MDFGERVTYERERQGLTRRALARKTGLQEFHLAKVERGERKDPSGSTIVKLARALGCTSDYLLGLTDDASEEEAAPSRTPVEAMDALRAMVGHYFDGIDAGAYQPLSVHNRGHRPTADRTP